MQVILTVLMLTGSAPVQSLPMWEYIPTTDDSEAVSEAKGQKRNELVKARCRSEWAGDFRMQAYCQEQQEEGYSELLGLLRKIRVAEHTSDMIPAIMGCNRDWIETEPTPDWGMVAYCVNQQYTAFLSLRQH